MAPVPMKSICITRAGLALAMAIGLAACGGGGASGYTGNFASGPVASSGGGGSTPPPAPTPPASGWAWMSGSSTEGVIGVYGTQGTAASTNVPGSRYSANTWIDGSGNLWVFGGFGADDTGSTLGPLNDLWMFSPASGEWTWKNGNDTVNQSGVYGTLGVAAAGNTPGARYGASSWQDAAGFYLFGGDGYDNTSTRGNLSDLWLYSTSTNEWEWVGGPESEDSGGTYGTLGTATATNWPGARVDASAATDSTGNLWLFGGYGDDSTGAAGDLNDLWQYNPLTGEWTWEAGSSTVIGRGTYGAEGVPASSNEPGPRDSAAIWFDSSGDLWLFGGYGADSAANVGFLNDLWMFSPTTGEWTWEGGSDLVDQAGAYGTEGTAASAKWPGARAGDTTWKDASGNIWMFGGQGFDSTGTAGYLSDLWMYNPSTKAWAWEGGSNLANQAGTYGTLGTAASGNIPGGRQYAATIEDGSGNVWMFGGQGDDSNGASGYLNDLWKLTP